MIVTYRYRVKNLNGLLNKQAKAVNYVWNFCNDTQKFLIKWRKPWLTAFELMRLTSGTSQELGLSSYTINAICSQYVESRRQKKLPYLRYRGEKSLGWIPLKSQSIRYDGADFIFMSARFRVFNSRPLPECRIRDGSSFSQDSRGNWFLNVVVDVPVAEFSPTGKQTGIDLGLKHFATLSGGQKIDAQCIYRGIEPKLAMAQRARKKNRVKAIHAKAANTRKDFHHKLSTGIVKEFDYIAVGNVNAAALAKTNMAKSVRDAGWSSFRNMIRYKAIGRGATYEEVNESFTSQVCSACGCLPTTRPVGIADLGIRIWTCSDCGYVHDRDVNAAVNILLKSKFRLGHQTLVVGAASCGHANALLGGIQQVRQ